MRFAFRVRTILQSAAMAGAFLVVATPAGAVNSPRAHDGGFFLRLSGGFGWAKTSIDDPDLGDIEMSGPSGDINLAIGGIVSPNLALHGTLWGWSTTDPDLETDALGDRELDGDLSLNGLGGGLTYYFPSNLYISGSIGAAWLSLDARNLEGDTDAGFGMDLTLGKEWWVGRSWGLGVAGGLGIHSIPDKDIDENWTGTSLGLRFSATLN